MNGMFSNIPPVTKALLIVNVALYVLTYLTTGSGIELYDYLSLFYFGGDNFKPLQIVTHMFMHGDFMHLIFNMIGLLFFGHLLESVWGGKRFLFFYFFAGIGAAIIHMLMWHYIDIPNATQAINDFVNNPTDQTLDLLRNTRLGREYIVGGYSGNLVSPEIKNTLIERAIDIKYQYYNATRMLGASGAVSGILLAIALLFPNAEVMIIPIPVPIKAKFMVMGLIAYDLFMGLSNFSFDNVAHFAHLGGMLFAFILMKYWQKFGSRFNRF